MADGCRAKARTGFLVAAVALTGAACSPPPPSELPGSSSRPRPAGGSAARPAPAPQVHWEAYERVKSWPPLTEPFPSAGHAPPRYLGSPRVAPERRATYEALVPGASIPVGFMAAMVHTDRETGHAGPIYALEKLSDGAWRFTVASASGKVLARGELQGCTRCHAEAPSDGLFGLPERPGAEP